jgi:hypothetical protein
MSPLNIIHSIGYRIVVSIRVQVTKTTVTPRATEKKRVGTHFLQRTHPRSVVIRAVAQRKVEEVKNKVVVAAAAAAVVVETQETLSKILHFEILLNNLIKIALKMKSLKK